MWDFSIGSALGMMVRTLPFLLLRLAVYFGITLGYILITGAGAGIGYGIGGFGDEEFRAATTTWGGVAGFVLFGAIMYWVREYILYLVKAGHIAVLIELIDGNPMPQGRSQVAHATAVIKQRFPQASVLFGVDQLIKGVVRTITGMMRGILTVLPIPGVQQLAGILSAFLRVAVGFVDEVILAYAIRTQSDNAWMSAKEALVLYGQNYKVMLKNAAWLAVIIYVLSFLVFLIMLAPAALVVYLIPGAWSAGGVVFALLFAWSVKAALLEPFAITCMMQVYFKTIEGQEPNPEWEAKLEQMSGKFRKLKDRAFGDAEDAPTDSRPA
ncbi:hypothetical protein [Vreelandella subglaciescola]|jgi:hypothetical protein|uniref:Uncharacterized protein n=1 Tax=Vreelandella subglaciescola TaxID=29571 RepID=A0A1M7IC68_9GAMM|nr:hypothetical protein [Halomonas subglaciescola]SHM38300.1 hypothetical protein SAMN05878437_2677 [Halomonas subglaciescola]